MSSINLNDILPRLKSLMEELCNNTEKGSKVAASKDYHQPSLKDYLLLVDRLLGLILPGDVSFSPITGRVNTTWYFDSYCLLVEAIPQGDMYNVSIVPQGDLCLLEVTNTTMSLSDLSIVILLHALSNNVSLSSLLNTVKEVEDVKKVVCKKPLVKASGLPRA